MQKMFFSQQCLWFSLTFSSLFSLYCQSAPCFLSLLFSLHHFGFSFGCLDIRFCIVYFSSNFNPFCIVLKTCSVPFYFMLYILYLLYGLLLGCFGCIVLLFVKFHLYSHSTVVFPFLPAVTQFKVLIFLIDLLCLSAIMGSIK